jgi:hypothetical protein
MALNIEIGEKAKAKGICCIAIGDNTSAYGAFQVDVGKTVTLPAGISNEQYEKVKSDLDNLVLVYKAMNEQKHAPVEFFAKAECAISTLKTLLDQEMARTKEENKTKTIDMSSLRDALPTGFLARRSGETQKSEVD